MAMTFCSRCGNELVDKAYFCSKCGYRTPDGEVAGISYPVIEDVKVAFTRAGDEIDRAFTQAGKELDKAFRGTRDNIKTTLKGNPIICPNCKQENSRDSRFCKKCGKPLA